MVILIDMDDTMEQLLKAWLERVNAKYNKNVAYEEIKSWDVSAPYEGLTREQVYDVIKEPGFWGTVEPIEGAAEAIKHFMEAGHEVFIVTATDYESVPEKMDDLLFKWFPFIDWHQVIITKHKELIHGHVMIDDGVHNLEGNPCNIKILMTAPHNVEYDAEKNGMIRVRNWSEIEEVVNQRDIKGI